MKYTDVKKDRKKELREEKEKRPPMGPHMKKLVRIALELGIAVIGAAFVVLSRILFASFADGSTAEVARDNFELYFNVSLILSGVLLVLTLFSALTFLFQKEVSRFQRITASASPVICSVSLIAVAVFYAYLTAGGAVSITPYVILLGIGEAMIFRFPCAVCVMLRKTEKGKKKK